MLKELLILIVPGAVGVLLYRYLEKTKWGIWTYLENYSLFVLLVYIFARTAFYLGGMQEFSIRNIDLNIQIKFGILSIIFSVILAGCLHYGKAVCKLFSNRQ